MNEDILQLLQGGSLTPEETKQLQEQLIKYATLLQIPDFPLKQSDLISGTGSFGPKTKAALQRVLADSESVGVPVRELLLDPQQSLSPASAVQAPQSVQQESLNAPWARKQASVSAKQATKKAIYDKQSQLDIDRQKGVRDVYNIGDAAVTGARGIEALRQIQRGKDLRQDAERPQYTSRAISPELQRAYETSLANAGQGFTAVERGAYNQQALAEYANRLRGVGGNAMGQSGIAAILAQNASRQSGEQAQNMAIADARLRQGNQQLANQAGAQVAADRANLFDRQTQLDYLPKLQDYRRQMGEASALERSGRMNLDTLMSTAPYKAANVFDQYYGSPYYTGEKSVLDYNNPNLRRLGRKQVNPMLGEPIPETPKGEYMFEYNPNLSY